MAGLPKSLQPKRSVTSLDQERESFEKAQAYAISKAINETEVPVKVKHVRSAIIGTFQEKGSHMFWSIVLKLPLDGNPIVMWKFCHTLHKLLREGHGRVIHESCRYRHRIMELGKLWGHLKDGYGKLIASYTSLLVSKLSFHQRNPRFPGNLMISDSELDAICEKDVNNYFQLSVEIFDYMDEILAFQAAVFGSLDMSRSNSMTNAGQCRLSPLIPCIQDSTQLYDFSVKLLFRLHNCLPPDTLVGHRDRFLKQFRALKQFYEQSSNLQYFKTLIQVPLLGENPPNFLISSELSRHVTPVAILPPEKEPVQQQAADPVLVDFDSASPDGSMADLSQRNGSISPDLLAERDRYIEHLLHQIEQISAELERIRAESQRQIASLRQRILDLEETLAEKESDLEEALKEKKSIEEKLSQAAKSAEQGSVVQLQLQETEKRANLKEEKFNKLKEVYQKLRDEHISLLRQKADTDKKLSVTNAALEQSNKAAAELQQKTEELHKLQQETQLSLQAVASEQTEKLRTAAQEKEMTENIKKELEETVRKLEGQLATLQSDLSREASDRTELEKRLRQMEQDTKRRIEEDRRANFVRLQKLLVACASRGEHYIKDRVDDLAKPPAVVLAAQNESMNIGTKSALDSLNQLASALSSYFERANDDGALGDVIPLLFPTAQNLGNVLGQSQSLAHSLPDIEKGEKLIGRCSEVGGASVQLFKMLQDQLEKGQSESSIETVKAALSSLESMTEALCEEFRSGGKDDVGDQLEDELGQMERAIEEAAGRIAELWNRSRESYTGVKLEVNEKVLDSCTALMKAIRQLITKAKILQEEIVARGKGSASAKEFYKRNHRWTEGLLSAAKTVGFGAKLLVDAADKVVQGQAKFDQLTVASQEIAASTAQLVFASRVKADPHSANLQQLSQASKGVSQATGGVVATAKLCAQMVEDSSVMDFGNLTLHQAKRLEMESQVKVLELESSLTKERHRLGALRRQHYQLAGELEGWDNGSLQQ